MGSPGDEPGRGVDETQHQVTLTRGFWLKTTEATQGQWKAAFGGSNPANFLAGGDDCPVENVSWWSALEYANALSASESLAACFTVSGCTSGTAAAGTLTGCTALTVNAAGGNPYLCTGYRLPTESEWEYAYRAGAATAFYNAPITNTGETPLDPGLHAIGWYLGNSDVTYSPSFPYNGRTLGTHPAKGKTANAWGL